MIGREKELSVLEEAYGTKGFQFLVMSGRRRVGKTTILQEFAHRHPCLFFSAQEKNDALNLQDFSRLIQTRLLGSPVAPLRVGNRPWISLPLGSIPKKKPFSSSMSFRFWLGRILPLKAFFSM